MRFYPFLLALAVGIFVHLIFFSPSVSSIGVVAYTQGVLANESERVCGKFGVFNDAATDSLVNVEVDGTLKEIFDPASVASFTVPGNTHKDDALPTEFCFTAGQVYPKDCVLGTMCSLSCPPELFAYTGSVSMVSRGTISGGGSSASLSIPFDFTVRVKCEPLERSYAALFIGGGVLVVGFLLWFFLRRRSLPTSRNVPA